MLSVIMLIVVMLIVIMLSGIMLSVIKLSIMAQLLARTSFDFFILRKVGDSF
jgi:hypothetical protein